MWYCTKKTKPEDFYYKEKKNSITSKTYSVGNLILARSKTHYHPKSAYCRICDGVDINYPYFKWLVELYTPSFFTEMAENVRVWWNNKDYGSKIK